MAQGIAIDTSDMDLAILGISCSDNREILVQH